MVSERISVLDEVATFLAALSPKKVLAFETSQEAQARVNFLLEKNKTKGLSLEENKEMEHYMLIEHLVQLAKAQALLRLVKK